MIVNGIPSAGAARVGFEHPYLSVVIPVYNEAANLEALHARLASVLDQLGRSYEVIFVDDGSRDDSMEILSSLHAAH
ncbi:MAG TPA: glycosyltransferase, partial [Candidatus Methylomirabilis sp.]